jgi:hypothetical protein
VQHSCTRIRPELVAAYVRAPVCKRRPLASVPSHSTRRRPDGEEANVYVLSTPSSVKRGAVRRRRVARSRRSRRRRVARSQRRTLELNQKLVMLTCEAVLVLVLEASARRVARPRAVGCLRCAAGGAATGGSTVCAERWAECGVASIVNFIRQGTKKG